MEARDRLLTLLNRTQLGQAFSEGELQQLLEIASVSEAEAGSLLFVEGSPSENLWILLSGEGELLKNDTSGQTTSLEKVPAGVTIGELGFVLNLPQLASLRTTQPSLVFALHRTHFDRLVETTRLGSKLALRLTELAHKHLEQRLLQTANFLQDYQQALDSLYQVQTADPETTDLASLRANLASQSDRLSQNQSRLQQQLYPIVPHPVKSRRPRVPLILGSVVGIGAIGAATYFSGAFNRIPQNPPPFVIPNITEASQCTGEGRYWYDDRCFDLNNL